MSPHPLLAPLVPLYRGAVAVRGYLHDAGRLPRRSLVSPVVSVGNLVVGGSGKTPVVAWVARFYRDLGYRAAVLSRGHGRQSRGLRVVSTGSGPLLTAAQAGDEPFLLARELPGVRVVVAADRAQAGDVAETELLADVHVLDDGFQHRRLLRQVDLVLLDASLDHQRLRLLPAGPLREPLAALARAHAVLVTRAHRPHDEVGIRRLVRRFQPRAPVFSVRTRFTGLVSRDGAELPVSDLAGLRVVALSGLGNPGQFEANLADLGAELRAVARFRDHHRYRHRDLQRLAALVRRSGAAVVVTTLKDLVRLEALPPPDFPLLALRIEAQVSEPQELRRLLAAVFAEPLRSRL